MSGRPVDVSAETDSVELGFDKIGATAKIRIVTRFKACLATELAPCLVWGEFFVWFLIWHLYLVGFHLQSQFPSFKLPKPEKKTPKAANLNKMSPAKDLAGHL
jgi:hypothetical protein